MRRQHFVVFYRGLLVLGLALVSAPAPVGATTHRALGNPPSAIRGAHQAPQSGAPADSTPDFQDVPTSSPFYGYLHNLYLAGAVAGYACGGAGEPCVPPANLPYYRPGNGVTRLQMTKFIDLGRRNIADAVGTTLAISGPVSAGALVVGGAAVANALTISNALYISSPAAIPIHALTTGSQAVEGDCLVAGLCFGIKGSATQATNYGGVFNGGWVGMYADQRDANGAGVDGIAVGAGSVGVVGSAAGNTAGSYAGEFANNHWNALRVDAQPADVGRAEAWVSAPYTSSYAVDLDPGSLYINGNLIATGSKSGYVVDAMQNAGSTALEPGDVVVVVGSGPPINGRIPVVRVKKATTAYDSAIAGVVDQALYVPDVATRVAYQAQQAAIIAAEARRNQAAAVAAASGGPAVPAPVQMPAAPITDEQGLPHGTDAPSIPPGGYMNVVTLGAYPAVKVDASAGPIHAGDLLTTSPHAGYAQVVTDKAAALGAVIGKALADLASGTGTIPVLVTLR